MRPRQLSPLRKLHSLSNRATTSTGDRPRRNLSISKSVLRTLTKGLEDPVTGENRDDDETRRLFQAAKHGQAIRKSARTEGKGGELAIRKTQFRLSFLSAARSRARGCGCSGYPTAISSNAPLNAYKYLQIGEPQIRQRGARSAPWHYDVDLYEAAEIRVSQWIRRSLQTSASECRSTLWWCATDHLRRRHQSPHRGRRSPTSTICARDGRRRSARRTENIRGPRRIKRS